MIKINLLGKKKSAIPPQLAFLHQLEKIGINAEMIGSLQGPAIRIALLIAGVYAVAYVPDELLRRDLAALDGKIAVLNQRRDQLSSDLAQKKDLRKKMEEINKSEAELQRQLSAITALSKERTLAYQALDGLITILPEKVWLRTIALAKDQRLSVAGNSWEHNAINDFVKAITDTTRFTDVQFKGITTEPGTSIPGISAAAQRIKTFDVEFRIKGPGES